MEHLDISVDRVTDDALYASMPVDERHCQPLGVLHGGISCVLAETVGSYGSWLLVDMEKYYVVGQQISCNHVRPVPKGDRLTAEAKILHRGKRSHVWDITMTNKEGKTAALARLTVAVVEKH